MSSKDDWPREKQWKNLYTRSVKLARAQQLGIDYPRTTEKQLIQGEVMSALNEKFKVLFICSRNQWRSPTAEQLWRRHPKVSARSAGTSPNARHKVSIDDIAWADVILVMEEKHKSRLTAEFTRLLSNKRIHVLDIPDDYRFMDPELVEMLEQSVNNLLGLA
jgi:predicted protein tyrosine phosphatase